MGRDKSGLPQGMGKDWGQLSRVPSTLGKSYQLKQQGEWWQRSHSPEKFEDENGELDSAFMERPIPWGYVEGPRGNKGGSGSGQSKSPLVRRTRRDDFELESSCEEKDRAYMHDSQNRDTDMGAGYASPREQDPHTSYLHSGVSASQRGNEAHNYRGDMNGPGIQALVPTYREHYWQESGVIIPLRGPPEGVGIGTSITP